MATQRQIESARRNGKQSKGPITPEGKSISALNAIKHGLSADLDITLNTEDDGAYDRLLQAYMDSYQPATGEEHDLVCQVVSASWRLRRIARMEANLLNDEMDSHELRLTASNHDFTGATLEARAFRYLANTGQSLALAIRYGTAARRSFDLALKTLRDTQRERLKSEKQNEPDSAKLPAISTSKVVEKSTSKVVENPARKEPAGAREPVLIFPSPAAIENEPAPNEPAPNQQTTPSASRQPMVDKEAPETVSSDIRVNVNAPSRQGS